MTVTSDRVAVLEACYEREVALREQARAVELDPSRSEEARRLFARASVVRRERLALLRRWRLL